MKLILQDRSPFSLAHRKKVKFILVGVLFWFMVISLRLLELQVLEHKKLKAEVVEQTQDLITVLPTRGTIFDRNGKILARSLPAASVFFSPVKGESLDQQIKGLYQIQNLLGLKDSDLRKIINSIEKRKRFTWIKRKIPLEVGEKILKLKLPGIYLLQENRRFYPQGQLAAHVLGGVNIDDYGLAGVEYFYNSLLRGEEGQQLIMKDARKREFFIETIKETRPGQDIYLSLDSTIQYLAEKELQQAVEKHQANWGCLIISIPWTGEILAMANYPSYDPNDFPPSEKVMANRVIQHTYEPGSTVKIVTAAAARELAGINWNTYYDCSQGYLVFGGTIVRDHVRMGVLSFPEVFIQSSNVGAIKIADRAGAENIYRMFRAFCFGEKTGIDLPGEEAGIVHPLEKWRKSSLRVAIGYELAATPLQVLRAMNVFATGGYLVQPRVRLEGPAPLSAIRPASLEAPAGSQPVLSPKTARELVNLVLRQVVEKGTGREAGLPGYVLAGKTGTAQKYDPELRAYSSSRHVASFAGFVPADHPLISMMVVIDEPHGQFHYGGQVAAPVFREVARKVLLYLNQLPEKVSDRMILARKESLSSGVHD
ncbi:MAG: penicillin-binding protein 2 [Candidatus Saccharicenans sp.]|nr:penicillin-binding protein 2 [Candidatus Saccharicenans sp.]